MFQKNLLKAAMVKRGYTVKSLALALGMNQATFYRKVQRDGDFTREEVNTMIKCLDLDTSEYKDIFFAEELA